MKRLQAMPGYLRRLARLSVVGACLGVPLGIAFCAAVARLGAQQPYESGIQRTYVNNVAVRLPIEIENAQRAKLQGLVLYVKDNPQGAWQKIEQGPPQQTEFVFQAPREGEYWFRIVAIDTQGRSHPSDLNNLQDVVVVVIDTTPPAVDVRFVGVTNEGTTVQCECRDANLDPLQTRFFFQTQDQVWRPLDPMPGRSSVYCIPRQAMLTNQIKVTAADLAHNTTTHTYNLGELAQAGRRRSAGSADGRRIAAIALRAIAAVDPVVRAEGDGASAAVRSASRSRRRRQQPPDADHHVAGRAAEGRRSRRDRGRQRAGGRRPHAA